MRSIKRSIFEHKQSGVLFHYKNGRFYAQVFHDGKAMTRMDRIPANSPDIPTIMKAFHHRYISMDEFVACN